MRILQVVPLVGAGGEFGGPVSVAEEHARELRHRGHDVTVVALRKGRVEPPAGLTASEWRTFPARRLVPGVGMLGLTNVRLVAHLWRAAGRADVVHVHAGRDLVSLTALGLARLRRRPYVAQTHGMVRPRDRTSVRLFDSAFLRLLRRAGRVLYLTDLERNELRQLLGPDADLGFLTNGLRSEPRGEWGPRPGPPLVVFLARLHPVKRVTAFAAVADLLRRRGVRAAFRVHGPDQGDLVNLRREVADRALEDVLEYAGALDHGSAVEALAAADVYVLPSAIDWMPMSLLEALALGVPSVCCDTCGLAPALLASGAGLVTDGSVEGLADAVQSVLERPDVAARLATAGPELVRRQFSVEAVADELERLYSDLRPRTTS